MSWRSKGLTLAILAIFLIQISSPMVDFPVDDLEENQSSVALSIGFSTGSGHDLEGDVINVDGKNWTVRGESILDYWMVDALNQSDVDSIDMIVTDSGTTFACSTNATEVYFHTFFANGSEETLVVQNLGDDKTDDCAIGITGQNRIVIAYGVNVSQDETNGNHIRVARLAEPNAIYFDKTWHIRTVAENVYDSGSDSLNLEIDTDSHIHIFFRESTIHGLKHLWFNKAFWNQTILDQGPIGSDIEVKIDSQSTIHTVYTYLSSDNSTQNEVRLLRFNETTQSTQILARGMSVSEAVGMDLDSNNIEQIAYSTTNSSSNQISLLRSLAGKDTGRIDPVPSNVITYDDDSVEGIVLGGDINADGMDDLVYTDPDGNGTISIHYGTSNGLAANADRILVGSFSDSNLGFSIAVGDFNCDGYDDLASSEPGFAENNSGHVSIRLGSADGISSETWWEMNGSADDNLGWSMSSLGDVESDGCDDLVIVADKMIEENLNQPTLSKNGLLMMLKGNSTSMIFKGNITQTDSGTMFGRQLATGGDINGDGYLDMVVSNTGTIDSPVGYSSVEFFYGSENGINQTPFKVHSVIQQGKLYGFEMNFIGDVHGDGYDDLIITELFAATAEFQQGRIHMYSGSSNGTVVNWREDGFSSNARLGHTVSAAGDINEDGFDDFLVMNPSAAKSGTVNLYLGSENGPRSDIQLLAQGATGENVGFNILSGMDFNGDGLGEILYSSRDLSQGDVFAPVLTVLSERDWEDISFDFSSEVAGIDLLTPLRGSPLIMVELSDSSLLMLENTPDGISSAGRWDYRHLTNVESAALGISNAGKPTILASKYISSNPTLLKLTVEGNTGLDYSLDTGTGVGKEMGLSKDSEGLQRIGHTSPSYSSIFYTEESENGYSTTLVRSAIDVLYPIQAHVDSNDKTRLVYVDDDDNMVRLSTLDGTWSEASILNTTVGVDFDSIWTQGDDLIFTQVALSNNTPYLQLVEYNGTNYTVSDIIPSNASALFELELVSDKLVLSVVDGGYLTVHERNLTGGNWTSAHQRWAHNSNQGDITLVMKSGYLLFDFNNSDQGILHRANDGNWSFHSIDVPDSETPHDFVVNGDRWHVTSTDSSMGSNNLVWTTGAFSDSTIATSTKFVSVISEHMVGIDSVDGDIVIAYSQSSTNDFGAIRIVSDADRDLIPDSHDALPNTGNQWHDSDSDGYGDNPSGEQPDDCPSETGDSSIDRFGCEDYDGDGWSDINDDCNDDDGTSWWGRKGCSDIDQDGWADGDATYIGDLFPTNWKQAIDSDGDRIGDNHGPDCCETNSESSGISIIPDVFPYNPMQWEDEDNDGYGDNESDIEFGDKCPWIQGYSWRDRLGCVDSDGDGSSDPSDFGTFREWNITHGADMWPQDPTQWADTDGDGYGDNSSEGATLPDKFPLNIWAANDTDGDSYPNNWTSYAYMDDDGDNVLNKDDWCENTTTDPDGEGCSAQQRNPSNDSYNYRNPSLKINIFLDNCPEVWGNSTSTLALVDGSYVAVAYYGCQDTDGDGREDSTDAFPADPTQFADSDGDGWGDNQQGNDPDACPFTPGVINGTKPNGDLGVGCPLETDDPDQDQDGVPDFEDDCPNTVFGNEVNEIGCSEYQIDDDLDNVFNANDKCPGTPVNTAVDDEGCSNAQKEQDTDGDGINDPDDNCPNTGSNAVFIEQAQNNSGCALYQLDSDNDEVTDDIDECPGTFPPVIVLANGCIDESKKDEDVDGDGYKGNYTYFPENDTHVGDAFPYDATQWQDMDGDGYGDNNLGNKADFCPEIFGTSNQKNRFGCIDTDGDGYHDDLGDDALPENPTQWEDADKDGWGDNQSGTEADQCLDTDWQNEVYRSQAEANFGCALYQLDSDNDGINDDADACPNTPAGADIYPSGCKIESKSEPTDNEDTILGMEPMTFYAVSAGGGLLFLGLLFIIISRRRGNDFDDDDDDDDDWFDDDEEDDFMSSILGNRGGSRGGPTSGPQRGPQRGPPSAGPQGRAPSRGPPGASPQRGPTSGPTRGPPGGPTRGPSSAGPARGPDPRGPQRGGASLSAATVGKKVAKRKPVSGDDRVRKTIQIEPDLFDKDELSDRAAAIDWTKSALKQGESERSILMQLQTTGWSAPQSRAIIDLSKQ